MQFFLKHIAHIGHNDSDYEDLKTQKLFLTFLAFFMSMGAIIWSAISIYYNLYFQSIIPLGYVVISTLNIGYFKYSINFNIARTIQTFFSLILPFLFQWSIGGFLASGFIMLWAILSLIASLSIQQTKYSIVWLILFLSLTLVSGIFDNFFYVNFKPVILDDFSLLFTILNICLISITIFGLVSYFIGSLKSTKSTLKSKQNEIEIVGRVIKNTQTELELKNEQLILANNSKSQFLTAMSHEIRTPLNGIIGISDILTQTELSSEQRDLLSDLSKSSSILNGLLNDVLDITQIEENKLIFNKNTFNLNEELNELLTIFKFQIKERGEDLALHYVFDDKIPNIVQCDLKRLKQVLTNLIFNSIKFTEKGFIKISVRLIKESTQEAILKFFIEDSGIGIAEENKNLIFNKFFRINEINSEGAGLGLTIAKNLVEKMGGSISFESQEGVGTTFSFELPILKVASETKKLAHYNAVIKPVVNNPILIVEDNKINRLITKKMLSNIGFTNISVAQNGLEGYQQAVDQKFDLILMDINMPIMGGMEATKKIFESYKTKKQNPPIIAALTANTLRDEVSKYFQSGMKFVLRKPFTQVALQKEIIEAYKL